MGRCEKKEFTQRATEFAEFTEFTEKKRKEGRRFENGGRLHFAVIQKKKTD